MEYTLKTLLGGIANGLDAPKEWNSLSEWCEPGTENTSMYELRSFFLGDDKFSVWTEVSIPERAFQSIMRWHREVYRGDLVDAQKDLLHESFKAAANYTNVMLVAGYAALFAFWVQMRGSDVGQFTPLTSLAAAIFMALSLAAFLSNEVFGMFMRMRSMLSIAQIVDDPSNFFERVRTFQESTATIARRFGTFWTCVVSFAIANALIAAVIMISALLHGAWLAAA